MLHECNIRPKRVKNKKLNAHCITLSPYHWPPIFATNTSLHYISIEPSLSIVTENTRTPPLRSFLFDPHGRLWVNEEKRKENSHIWSRFLRPYRTESSAGMHHLNFYLSVHRTNPNSIVQLYFLFPLIFTSWKKTFGFFRS